MGFASAKISIYNFAQNRWGLALLAIALLIQFLTLWIDIMDVDAAQYAIIARDMIQSGNWLEFYNIGREYLDKPPLTFWMVGLSYKVLGVTNFAYRFPSFLFGIWAIFSTWKLANTLYEQKVADLSALILGTSQAFFLMNNDVKTDMYLLAPVIFSVWQLYLFDRLRENAEKSESRNSAEKWFHLVAGFSGIGLAMLAKGPLGLVIPFMALGGAWIVQRKWKSLLRWEWLPGLAVTGLVLLPMLIGLYTQFDLHPEKTVNGETGVSGLRFFFWTQSFGRVTGESEWSNDTGPLFFVHTFLWASLPWIFFTIPALGRKLKTCWIEVKAAISGNPGNPDNSRNELISLMGFALPFLALSLSRFKLPHYIFVILPFAAIFTADYVINFLSENLFQGRGNKSEQKPIRTQNGIKYIFILLTCVAIAGSGLLISWSFPAPVWVWFFWLILVVFALGIWFYPVGENSSWPLLPKPGKEFGHHRPVTIAATIIIIVNFTLGIWVYPQMLGYQAPAQAGKYIKAQKIPPGNVATFGNSAYSLIYYAGANVPNLPDFQELERFLQNREFGIFYTTEKQLYLFQESGYPFQTLKKFPNYRVGNLQIGFLLPDQREKMTTQHYLLKVSLNAKNLLHTGPL